MQKTLMRTIGYGVLLYACMYLAWSLLGAYGFAGTFAARSLLLVVLLLTTLVAAASLRLDQWRDILPFSVSWVVTIAIVDMLFAAPSGSWQMFADPNLWVGYCLVCIAPIVVPLSHRHQLPETTA